MRDAANAETLEERVNDSINDGPFGPVEFKAYVHKSGDEYELFISHLKVHKNYRRQGLAIESIHKAAEMCEESHIFVSMMSIDIMNEGGAKSFLKRTGFTNIHTHDNQVSGQMAIGELLS